MASPIKFSFSIEGLGFAISGRAGEAWKFASSPKKELQCGYAKNSACQSGLNTVPLVIVCSCQLLLSAPAVWNPDLALWGLLCHTLCVCVCLCACTHVSVDSVWLMERSKDSSHSWSAVFFTCTMPSQIPNLLLPLQPRTVWVPSRHFRLHCTCKRTSDNKAKHMWAVQGSNWAGGTARVIVWSSAHP